MIAKTTLDVRHTRTVHPPTHTHTREDEDERAAISFLETAVPPDEPRKAGASYALVRLYFAFAQRHRRHRLLFLLPQEQRCVRADIDAIACANIDGNSGVS